MKRNLRHFLQFSLLLAVIAAPISATPDSHWYGESEDISFATSLWKAMVSNRLVGENALPETPYKGTHPHGAILESVISAVTIDDVERMVVVKRSYRGKNVSVETVAANRDLFLNEITVMLKREKGYDSENQDWFWAKYNTDGTLAATPNGVKLAGRIAKGKRKGCIACHRKADGDDYLFIN